MQKKSFKNQCKPVGLLFHLDKVLDHLTEYWPAWRCAVDIAKIYVIHLGLS